MGLRIKGTMVRQSQKTNQVSEFIFIVMQINQSSVRLKHEENLYEFMLRDRLERDKIDKLQVSQLENYQDRFIRPKTFHKRDNSLFSQEQICCEMPLGSFGLCSSSAPIQPMSQFGSGIVVFFRFLKLIMFFLALAILIQIPIIYFLYQNSDAFDKIIDLRSFIFAFSLGSLGLQNQVCAVNFFDPSRSEAFKLQCKYGKIDVNAFIYKESKQINCQTALTTQSTTVSLKGQKLNDIKEQCNGKSACQFSLFLEDFNNPFDQFVMRSRNYIHFLSSKCTKNRFPLWNDVYVSGEVYGITIVGIDILVILAYFLVWYNQKRAVGLTVEMFDQAKVSLSHLSAQLKISQYEKKNYIVLGEIISKVQKRARDFLTQNPGQLQSLSKISKEKVSIKMLTYNSACNQNYYIKRMEEAYLALDASLLEFQKKNPQASRNQLMDFFFQKCRSQWQQVQEIIKQKKLSDKISHIWVTFDSQVQRNIVVKAFKSSLLEVCCREPPSHTIFQGQRLIFKDGPNPDQIIWANLNSHKFSYYTKLVVSYLILAAIFAGTYIFLAFIQSKQRDLNQSSQVEFDCSFISFNFTTSTQYKSEWANVNYYPGYLHCYCTAKFIKVFDLAQCNTWLKDYLLSKSLPIIFSLIVVVFNFVIQKLLIIMTEIQGHKNSGYKSFSLIIKLFLLESLTSGIIILALNYKFISDSQTPDQFLKMLFGGQFNQFNTKWYLQIGYTVTITMIFNVVNPLSRFFIEMSIIWISRLWDKSGNCFTQPTRLSKISQYVQLYSGPNYTIQTQYSYLLTILTLTMLYGHAIPFLYMVCLACLVFTYTIQKKLLCSVYRRPPNFDTKLHQSIEGLLLIPLIAHCLAGIFIMSAYSLFPQPYSIGNFSANSSIIYNVQTYPYLSILAFLLLFLIFQELGSKLLSLCKVDLKEHSVGYLSNLNYYQMDDLRKKLKSDLHKMCNQTISISQNKSVVLRGDFSKINYSNYQGQTERQELKQRSPYVSLLLQLDQTLQTMMAGKDFGKQGFLGQSVYDNKPMAFAERLQKLKNFQKLVERLQEDRI